MFGSATCFHICNQKGTFIDYKEQESRMVSANGGDVEVKGIGSVMLKMYDGRMINSRELACPIN